MDESKFIFDLCAALAILIIAIVGSILPRKLFIQSGQSLVFQLGLLFSGGVTLAAALCHLLAEASVTLRTYVEDFPLAEFLTGCGFLLTLVIDEVAEAYTPKPAEAQPQQETPLVAEEHGRNYPAVQSAENPPVKVPLSSGLLLSVALTVHSVLEGLALGTEDDVKSSVGVFIAIAAHKGMAAYALGACIAEARVNTNIYWLLIGPFCIATPVGVLVGFAISEFSDSATSATIGAIAGGTLLYVTVMEIIPLGMSNKEYEIPKNIALIIGFGLMSMIARWS